MRNDRLRRGHEAGEMRNWIIIETPTDRSDSQGGSVRRWDTFTSVWAKIEARASRQVWNAEAPEKHVSHRVVVRWNDVNGVSGVSLNNKMRINWNGRYFNIHGFRDLEERERYVILDCEEGPGS